MLTQYQKDRIVKMYTVKKYTLEQTSKHFGITRERVRQIVREQIDIKGRLSTTIKSKNNCKLCGKAFTVTPSLVKTKLYCCTKHGRRGKIKYFTKAEKEAHKKAIYRQTTIHNRIRRHTDPEYKAYVKRQNLKWQKAHPEYFTKYWKRHRK